MEQELFEGLHKNRRWALEAVCQENLCRSWYLSYQLAGDAAGAASLLLSAWREALAALAEETPLGAIGTPEDVAEAIWYLSSDAARFVTGQVLAPNGGLVI